GDNWMITQQTAAYLVKRMTEVVNKPNLKPTESVDEQFQEYVMNTKSYNRRTNNFDVIGYPIELVRAFKQRASYLSYQAYHARVVEKKPWTSMMIQLHRLSRAHSESLLFSNFYEAVFTETPNPPLDDATLDVLKILFRLFALSTLDVSA